jgi:type IV pili sensor histidine kinase/response regulator
MSLRIKKTILFSSTVLLFSGSVYADPVPDPYVPETYIKTGRYSNIINEPVLAQSNPLKVVVNTKVPQRIKTVRETIEFLLMRSGYSLADESILPPETKSILALELPAVQRKIGPISLDKALAFLAGNDAFELVIDPYNRKVSFIPLIKLGEKTNEQK